MGVIQWLIIIGVPLSAWFVGQHLLKTPPVPKLDPNPWWGAGKRYEQSTAIRPFKINIPQQDVDDLKARLSLPSRIVSSMENTNFTYGVNSAAMSVILKYWKDNYNWQKREQKLNAFSHFKTRIDGLDIHFLRSSPASGVTKLVRPILLLHGWPGSIVEFYDMIPLLTTPRGANSDVVFDVICPSLPGYGFSDAAQRPGMSTTAMGQIFVKLMQRLGYDEFYAHGGDWGSVIIGEMAVMFPQNLIGIHITMPTAQSPVNILKLLLGSFLPTGWIMDPAMEARLYPLGKFFGTLVRESGYAHLHATKPDTLGVALSSSPQGLAAYILEKFSTWTNMDNVYKKDGGLLDPDFPFRLDNLLDNVCIYWFTNSITTSARLYAESMGPNSESNIIRNIPIKVPTGLAFFPEEVVTIPRNFASAMYKNLVTYTNPPRGGHFAGMEEPAIMADDIHNFVNTLEKIGPYTPVAANTIKSGTSKQEKAATKEDKESASPKTEKKSTSQGNKKPTTQG